jgi:hypothetical protein
VGDGDRKGRLRNANRSCRAKQKEAVGLCEHYDGLSGCKKAGSVRTARASVESSGRN